MRFVVLCGVLAAVVVATGAHAAINVTSSSTIDLTVGPPPVGFALGGNADKSRYVSDVAVTPNGTSFEASITGRLGGDSTVKDVVRLASTAGGTRTVTLQGTQVSNPNIPIVSWTVRNGGSTVATLDLRASSPSATFTIASGATYELDLRVKALRGIAANEAEFSTSVWAVVS